LHQTFYKDDLFPITDFYIFGVKPFENFAFRDSLSEPRDSSIY